MPGTHPPERDQLAVLGELAKALVTTRNLDRLLHEIVEAIGQVLDFYDCVLYLWDAERDLLCQRAAHGPKVAEGDGALVNEIQLRRGQGIVGAVAQSGVAEVITDTREDPRYIADIEENRSEIAVPIRFQDEVIGVIDAEAREPAAFTPSNLVLLTCFADFCAPAIVNAQRLLTERRRAEEALRQAEQRYQAIVERARDAVYIVDAECRLTYLNPAATTLFGEPEGRLLRRPLLELVPVPERETVEGLLAELGRGDANEAVLELPIQGRDAMRWTEQTITPLSSNGRFAGFQAIVRDVTERRNLEQRLVRLANHDPLTGLVNRYRFQSELEAHLDRARDLMLPAAVVWLDLDQFKDINDSEGHPRGDELLIAVANALRSEMRTSDVLARFGGDEFALLLRDADREEALHVAERILAALRASSFAVGNRSFRVTASVGIALIPEHGDRVDQLLARADLAMYAAKEAGRNCCRLYTPEAGEPANPGIRVAWGQRIRRALEEDRLRLYAQPIARLDGEPVHRYELLVRLVEGSTVILPGAFLPVAERYGLIHDLDRWVVGRAIRLLSGVSDERVEFEVNLSGKSLSDPELLPELRATLHDLSVDPRRLILEITETAALSDAHRAQRFIETLRSIGCRFALDDFGVGFSSFFHLKHLAIDYLKIDGGFVRNLQRDPIDQHLVRAIVEVARALGKLTIAEYVEDEATYELVRELGVDYAQGYAVGRPRPVSATFPELLSAIESR